MKKLFIFLAFGILLINLASAITWDNVAYYKLDETSGTTVFDSVGSFNGTNIGATNGVSGKVNNSYQFNTSTTSYISITNPSIFGTTTPEFSYSFWIYNEQEISAENDIYNINNNNYNVYIRLRGGSGTTNDYIYIPDGLRANIENYNTWIHVVYSAKVGGGANLSINGVLVNSSATNPHTGPGGYPQNIHYLATGRDLNPTYKFIGKIDEFGIWNRTLSSQEINDLYNSGSGVTYGIFPDGVEQITLVAPVNGTTLSTTGANFTANFSITGSNPYENYTWKNATYQVWKNNTLFNSTTVTLTGKNTQDTLFIDSFPIGNYEWNVLGWYGNATFSNYTTATKNYTYTVGATVSNYSYSSSTYETSSETFLLNVTLLEGSEISLVKLIYEGISYVVSDVIIDTTNSTTYGRIAMKIDIPLNSNPFSNQTNTFYWEFTYNGGQIQTIGEGTQEVSFINFQICNATYPTQTLNFTFFDELNQTNLNAIAYPTSILTNFNYWLGDGSVKKNYTFQKLSSSLNNYQFCINRNETTYLDMDMQYYSNDYAERTYYFRNLTISNLSQDYLLYSILVSEATKFTVSVKQGTEVLAGAIVGVWKYFVGLGDYRQVMVGLTDNKGEFSANLDLDQRYNFTIIKDNFDYGGIIKEGSCSASPCLIDLNIEESVLSAFDELYLYFAQNVDYNLLNNDTTKIVTLNFLDKLGTANYWRLFVYKTNYNNDSITIICDEKSYSSSGSLYCNYSEYNGDIIAKVYISRSPEKLVDFISFLNNTAPAILGLSAILASIIIILVIVFTGTRNPVVALVLLPFGLVVLKFIGFLPLDWVWIGAFLVFDLWLINRLNS